MDVLTGLLQVVNVFAIGIVTGGQVTTSLGLVPRVGREQDWHRLHRLFLDHKGEWHMPVAHMLTALTGVVLVILLWDDDETAALLTAAGTLLVLATLLISVRINLPINNALRAPEDRPENAGLRAKWTRFHYVRTILDVVAFALLAAAVATY